MNYSFLQVEPKEVQQFENYLITISFSQDIQKFDDNDNVSQDEFLMAS